MLAAQRIARGSYKLQAQIPTGSAYLFTLCGLQLFFGKLYTLFSIKWVFIISVVIFEIGSAICGGARTSGALIVGRAIAGVGAAGNFSGLTVVTVYTLPLEKRPACEYPPHSERMKNMRQQ
jgi:MFS family permease